MRKKIWVIGLAAGAMATFSVPVSAHGGEAAAGMLIGGGIGAAIGGPPGAAVGAIIGGIIGSDAHHHNHGYYGHGYHRAPPAYHPAPGYYQRAPAYYQPAPQYYQQPAPQYYSQPAPQYYEARNARAPAYGYEPQYQYQQQYQPRYQPQYQPQYQPKQFAQPRNYEARPETPQYTRVENTQRYREDRRYYY